MTTFDSNYFQLISDGNKVVLFNGEKEHYLIRSPILSKFTITIDRPLIDVSDFGGKKYYVTGLADYTVDLTFSGREVQTVDRPLIMGVDIFDKLSVNDYLDIINEKIKGRN